jgi:DNA-directed RNA polymerase subunit RPC12/RpoP
MLPAPPGGKITFFEVVRRMRYKYLYAVSYICAGCTNIIRNPVVQDVITCEKSGERGYVGPK